MADAIHIEGLNAFARALRLLPQNVGRNVLRGGVSAAARVIVTEARVRAPASTGTLRRSIIQKQIRELSDLTRQTFYVTVRHGKKYRKQGRKGTLSQDAYYARWVEYGTSKMAARPFLRPAFECTKEPALAAMLAYFSKRIPVEVRKLGFGWINK